MEGFGFSWIPEPVTEVTLEPKDTKEVVYRISIYGPPSIPPFIRDLMFVMEYQNLEGQEFVSKRALEQVLVRSGICYELSVGKYYPPKLSRKYPDVKFCGLLASMGGRRDGLFDVHDNEEVKTVIIGISGTLLSEWGFMNEEDILSAIKEIGMKKVQRMMNDGTLENYTFTTLDLPEKYTSGYDGFRKTCLSLE
jgi:hypothetical protein